ncbi:MAG: succinyl-diaminopimelate desuccinylase [Proteobacteria bacterium]|nr:succinyl-diaminopimelate desuccinylase [Pseudomonadota bacterium]
MSPLSAVDPVVLTQALVRCPSVTPAEGGALGLLAAILTEAGFEVHRPVFAEPGTPDIENLYCRIGTGTPALVFAGHTDVVPPGEETRWSSPPFSGDIRDGILYGRGACDMKAGVAASVSAVLRYLSRHGIPRAGSIAFLITGDEEGPAVNGTVKLLEWAKARGEVFSACVLGEPTNPAAMGDMLKIGRRGSLTGRITVTGRQGHVGYPHLAQNPVPAMVALLAALKATPLDAGTTFFDASNLEVTTVDTGNPATNVIPAEIRATFNIRFNDLWTPETLADEIIRRLAAAGTDVPYTITFAPTNSVAFLTKPGLFVHLVRDAVRAETGREPALSTTGGTSDARFIKTYCEVVEFGVVGATMHQIDECVAVQDIETLTRIYERIIATYFTA